MRIAIDIREISSHRAGKGRYVAELVKALQEIDAENEYILYGGVSTKYYVDCPRWRTCVLPVRGPLWHLAVARRLKRDQIDLYLATVSHTIPCIASVPCVMIVYDLAATMIPEGRLPFKVRMLERLLLKRAARRSAHVAAISNSTRNDLNRVCGIPLEKISVVGAGVGAAYQPTDRRVEGLPRDFLLFVGTIEPRKNVARLIRAYSLLDAALRKAFPLVLVGKKGWHCEEVDQALRECKASDTIRFMKYVEETDLPAIYSQATSLVYPSLYEGFGLPPLEAMACGTPVITSSTSSLPEVVGDAAIMVDPRDVEGLSRAINNVLSNQRLRDDLRQRGLERAKLFSWTEVARRMLQVFSRSGVESAGSGDSRRGK